MKLCFADTETFSECNLKIHGSARYAEHPSTELMICQWAVGEEEPHVHDCTDGSRPQAFIDILLDPDYLIVWQNGTFDRQILWECWGLDLPAERCTDTMVLALAHGLPGGLDKIGQVLDHADDEAKDKRGKQLIQIFCSPRPANMTLRRATRHTHPAEWLEFLEYSRMDIVSMRACWRDLPSWNFKPGHAEMALWHLDQKINARGFLVDLDLAHGAITAVAAETKRLKAETVDATDGLVSSPSKRDAMLTFILAEYGVDLPDMKADTLRRRIDDPELPDAVKLLLSIRLEATKTSTAKYKALVNATSADGRLRNTLQFAGAQRTARWAGRIFQPQNLVRPNVDLIAEHFGMIKLPKAQTKDLKQTYEDQGVAALKGGYADAVFNNVMGLTANLVRGAIIAKPGRKMVIADLANIEGRGLAFLAGESWKLQAFRAFDKGIGADLYKLAYAKAFSLDPEDVDDYQRQQGKVMELGCFAADTPVLTNNGVKAITEVSLTDLLWDGVAWVKHEGLLDRGARRTVNVAGIEVTPDHLILTRGTWKPAQELASNEYILYLALATGLENFPFCQSFAKYAERANKTWLTFSVRAAHHRTPYFCTTYATEKARDATRAQRNNQPTGASISTGMPILCRTKTTALDSLTEYQPASTVAIIKTMLALVTTAGAAFLSTSLGAKIAGGFWRTWSALKGGITRFSNLIENASTKATPLETSDSLRSESTTETGVRYESCKPELTALKPTFDISNSGPSHRFTILTAKGPLIVHNCGYEGGVAAFLTFAAVYNMDLDELADAVHSTASRESLAAAYGMWDWTVKKGRSTFGLPKNVYVACEVLKASWRAAHPATKALWAEASESVKAAIATPGLTFDIGDHLKARRDGAWLRIRLPSGRYLCYLQPKVDDKGQITYRGVNQYTRQWGRIKTYGGKLIENCTQAFARDVMAHNMPTIEASGYPITLTVHDEIITEPVDSDEFTHETLAGMMTANPPWAQGLPLAAAGFSCKRYHKG